MMPRRGLRSTFVSSKTCWRNSASSHSEGIGVSLCAGSRIAAVARAAAVLADDLALLLFHARAAALAVVHPLDDAAAAVDRAIVHGGRVAPGPATSQRLPASRTLTTWPGGAEGERRATRRRASASSSSPPPGATAS